MSKVNISISDEILDEIDKIRKEKGITRSEFLRKAFKTYLEVLTEEKKEENKRKGIEKAIQLQDEIRKAIGKWDSTEDLRKWREARK